MQVSLTTPAHPTWKNVRCHDWKGDAIDEGDAVADWLTSFLKQKVRLVKYGGNLHPSTVTQCTDFAQPCCCKFVATPYNGALARRIYRLIIKSLNSGEIKCMSCRLFCFLSMLCVSLTHTCFLAKRVVHSGSGVNQSSVQCVHLYFCLVRTMFIACTDYSVS